MSLTLNGTSDFARVNVVIAAMPMTFVAWAKPTAAQLGNLIAISASDSNHGYRILMNATRNAQVSQTGVTTAAFDTGGTTATLNSWSLFVGKFNANNFRAQALNNSGFGSNSTSAGAVTSPVRTSIGVRDINTPTGFFVGVVGACAIWNLSLVNEDVTALWQGWNPRRIKGHGLVFFAQFPTAGTIRDLYGNHMAVTGGSTSMDGPPMALA